MYSICVLSILFKLQFDVKFSMNYVICYILGAQDTLNRLEQNCLSKTFKRYSVTTDSTFYMPQSAYIHIIIFITYVIYHIG